MLAKPLVTVLLVVIVLLTIAGLFATDRVFYYQDLYRNDPQIKVEKHNQIVYNQFDPNRSAAYTCNVQKPDARSIGMICSSPDDNIMINCTVTPENPGQYFC